MPPNIKFYEDVELKKLSDGSFDILDAGTEKPVHIICHNAGDGELFDVKVEVIRDAESPMNLEITSPPPHSLKPKEKAEIKMIWRASSNESAGRKKVTLKVTGRYVR